MKTSSLARLLKKHFESARKRFLADFSFGAAGRWYAIEGGPLESFIEIREEIRIDTESKFNVRAPLFDPSNPDSQPTKEILFWVFEVRIASSTLTERRGSFSRQSFNSYPKDQDLLDGLKFFRDGPLSAAMCLFQVLESAMKVGLERDAIVDMMNAIIVHQVMKS